MRKYSLSLVIILLIASIISGCSSPNTGGNSAPPSGQKLEQKRLTLGSGVYAETWLMAELAKVLLEEKGGFKVEHIQNFSGATLLHNATISGNLDGYVTHTGTQFTGILEMEVTDDWKDRQKVFDYCKQQFGTRYKMTWLPPFGFNDTYAIVVTKEFAETNNVKKISDLVPLSPKMAIGIDQTFLERAGDGYKDFTKSYGLSFKKPVTMEYNLMYSALVNQEVDALVAYSTDGRIASLGLVPLEDDNRFFPPYDGALVLSNKTLEQYPEIREVLKPLWGLIDDEAMCDLNAEVDVNEREFTDVAREFLKQKGII